MWDKDIVEAQKYVAERVAQLMESDEKLSSIFVNRVNNDRRGTICLKDLRGDSQE